MWQHLPEKLNPVAFHLGPIAVSWYGIMYIIAFALVYFLVRYRIRSEKLEVPLETVEDFFPWGIAGVFLGARLFDVVVYDWSYFQNHLSQIFLPFDIQNHWQYIGIYGMSYFGGFIGLAIALYFFTKLRKINILELSDLFAPVVPLALAFGRLGNFINGELYGRITNKPWAMYFPADFSRQLRHPSQIYEMLLEGILLFIILWSIRRKNFPIGYLSAFFLIGYGLARFLSEFFRQPDNGWFFLSLTIGQWFSFLIIIIGLYILIHQKNNERY